MLDTLKQENNITVNKKRYKVFKDFRGELTPIEFSEIPFDVKRLFYVSNVPEGMVRGEHAHHTTQQFLICLKGEIEVGLEHHESRKLILHENEGVLIDKMIWDWQRFLTGDDVLLVLCSSSYNVSDYITDKDEFLRLIQC
ncbi:WxcM-like domain-containing protein [Prolixibacteraceae bacterium JC049]|nr:WxcM-like domain-containing protein [Prolixibacteraceae bacterium JC049]